MPHGHRGFLHTEKLFGTTNTSKGSPDSALCSWYEAWERLKKTELDSSHWYPVAEEMRSKRQWAQTEIPEIPFKYKKSCFTARVTEHWHRLHSIPGDTQHPSGLD